MLCSVKLPWVICTLDHQRYAVSCEFVRELVTFNHQASIPGSAEHVRGVINRRGKVITLVDLRVWLGMPSVQDGVDSLIAELEQREQDHRDWLAELDAAIREQRPFQKTTDPHQCAFGKWYDRYESENLAIRMLLREFDAPHKAIHGVAEQALRAAEEVGVQAAQALIERTRMTTLQTMITLFQNFRETLRNEMREIALVVEHMGETRAIVVDSVESVESLPATFDTTSSMQHGADSNRIPWIGRHPKDDSHLLIPDIELLFTGA